MLIKGIEECDIVNYKKTSMFILFPNCTFKCEKDCGEHCCQNSALAQSDNIAIDVHTVIERYVNNPMTSAIVIGGLEPFDSWNDLKWLVSLLRSKTTDDIVIYTGYNKNEIPNKIQYLRAYRNIIVKFGRFIPNQQPHFDEVLGVSLASNNQYAERIS
jgi:hypothetical protein